MIKAQKLTDNVWKINADSNLYIFVQEKLVIDTGPEAYKAEIEEELHKIIDPAKIEKVVLTHLHYDHCGNIDLFPNADVFASEAAVDALKHDRLTAVLHESAAKKIGERPIKPFKTLKGFEIIPTPGHTVGHTCFLYTKEKMLFSGDLLFNNNLVGRTDLPNSDPDEMEKSLSRVKQMDWDILCPGHDY